MNRSTSIVLDADGAPVVRHEAPAGPAADALRREASTLALARGPGVVDLVDAGDGDRGSAWLMTRYVAGGTLSEIVHHHGEEAAIVALAHIATTLAELHDRGIVHGRCTADHVIGAAGAPVLCGFSAAAVALAGDAVEPGLDTLALAALVASTCTTQEEPARHARLVVEGLTTRPPRTDLRTVAAALLATAGPAETPGVPVREHAADMPAGRVLAPRRGPPRTGSRPRRSRRRRVALAGAAVTVAVTVGLLVLTRSAQPGAGTAAPRATDPIVTEATAIGSAGPAETTRDSTDADPPTTEAAGADGSATGVPPTRSSGADVAPGDGERPLAPTGAQTDGGVGPSGGTGPGEHDGGAVASTTTTNVLTHDGVRYRVGAPGDLIVVGDWDCDGTTTPTVVRPSDGSVWAFPGWAGAGEILDARPLGHAPSPASARATPVADGCDAITVTTADGQEVIVRPVR